MDINNIKKYLNESLRVAEMQLEMVDGFLDIAELVKEKMEKGGTLFFCGNGGSAADSQHLAAELVGRFKKNRKALRSIALTTDSSIITSNANDIGYENIFARQLEALGSNGDVLIAISTSGESPSIIKAVSEANKRGLSTVAFTKKGKNSLNDLAHYSIDVPSSETGVIQQSHITFGQLLCYYLEENLG
jgi:D-sedoheptulose 7-phosphate isomerase